MWNKNFLENNDNWHMDTFNNAPYILAIKYRALYNMVKNSEFYGAFFTTKDMFEVIIKYYTLCACAASVNDGREEVVKVLCDPTISMSLGDWVNTLTTVEIKSFGEQSLWGKLLSLFRRFYNEKNLVCWRNDNIGHGALASVTDPEFIADIQDKIIILKELLENLNEYYSLINLEENGVKLSGEFSKPSGKEELTILYNNGHEVSLYPFIHIENDKSWFYDSMDRNGIIRIVDYLNGKRIPWTNSYFTGLRKKYYSSLNISDKGDLLADFYKRPLDNAMDAYYKEDNYHKQTYLLDWLKESMLKHDKGVLLLNAEQGTGKSTFSYALDELGSNKLTIPNAVIRTYYCNRTSIRTAEDFTTSISRIFLSSKDGASDFRCQYEDSICGVSFKDNERTSSMTNLLKVFRDLHSREYGKEKLLLILDGVDELNTQALPILSFIPEANELPEGVYILLTCRSDSLPAPMLLNFIQRYSFTQSVIFHRRDENRELLISAINKIYRGQKTKVDKIYLERLADQFDNRFSYIKILECAVNSGIDVLNSDKKEMIDKYLGTLKKYYGESLYRAFLRLLAVAVIAEHPLTMKEAAFMASGEPLELRDLAFLYDMKPLLTPYHDIFGGLLLWGNSKELMDCVEDDFKDIIVECIEIWEATICAYHDLYPPEADGYGYICSHFFFLKNTYLDGWVNYSSSEKNVTLMESINSFAVVYGIQNNQYYVKERCKLMLESIEALVKNENVKYPENIRDSMYLVSMVNKVSFLLDTKDLKRAEALEIKVKTCFEKIGKGGNDTLSLNKIMFKFYADMFTLYASQRMREKAKEYYELAQRTNKMANFDSKRVLQLNYLNFIKEINPEKCIELINEILSKETEYSSIDIARMKYNQGHAYDILKSNGKNISADAIQRCYDEGLQLVDHAVLCPENMWVNTIQSLLLIAKSKCYRKWENKFDEAIEVNEMAVKIFRFHLNIGNLVDLENVLDALRESWFLLQLRNQLHDKKEASILAKEAINLLERSNQAINPNLAGNVYCAYANSLSDLNEDIDENIRAWEQAIKHYRITGLDDSNEMMRKMDNNLRILKDKRREH